MPEFVESFITGTIGLLVVLAISTLLAHFRTVPKSIGSFKSILLAAICFHLIHLTEEAVYDFHRLFPELLGLVAWPLSLFLSFNILWAAIWIISASVEFPNRFTLMAFYFLALASAVNAIAHPVLSLLVGGYFPGLISSPFVGVLGIILLRKLTKASSNDKQSTTII